jgi:hypothetical protein
MPDFSGFENQVWAFFSLSCMDQSCQFLHLVSTRYVTLSLSLFRTHTHLLLSSLAFPSSVLPLPNRGALHSWHAHQYVVDFAVEKLDFFRGFGGCWLPPDHLWYWESQICTQFAFLYDGVIDVTTAGHYAWEIGSDDGSQLFIDGVLLIDNDGLHPHQDMDRTIAMDVGEHWVRMAMFQNTGQSSATIRYRVPGSSAWVVPPVYHTPASGIGETVVEVVPVEFPYKNVNLEGINATRSGFDVALDVRHGCQSGIQTDQACCSAACGTCGGAGCGDLPGGLGACCVESIYSAGLSCNSNEPPCVITDGTGAGWSQDVALVYSLSTLGSTASACESVFDGECQLNKFGHAGDQLTVAGYGFGWEGAEEPQVFIGDVECSLKHADYNVVDCVVPDMASGSYPVTVASRRGLSRFSTRPVLSGGNDDSATNLQACTGECDSDNQCAEGLLCFQRSHGESIPGCTGAGGGADWDYCYSPHFARCVDVQPPSAWTNPTCALQMSNTDNCAARRAGTNIDGFCALTCGVCDPAEAVLLSDISGGVIMFTVLSSVASISQPAGSLWGDQSLTVDGTGFANANDWERRSIHNVGSIPLQLTSGTRRSITGTTVASPLHGASDTAGCVDTQPPKNWANPSCVEMLLNTENCAKQQAGTMTGNERCSLTCGVCDPGDDLLFSATVKRTVPRSQISTPSAPFHSGELVDGNKETCVGVGQSSEPLIFDFGRPVKIGSYSFVGERLQRYPNQWQVRASNDGSFPASSTIDAQGIPSQNNGVFGDNVEHTYVPLSCLPVLPSFLDSLLPSFRPSFLPSFLDVPPISILLISVIYISVLFISALYIYVLFISVLFIYLFYVYLLYLYPFYLYRPIYIISIYLR